MNTDGSKEPLLPRNMPNSWVVAITWLASFCTIGTCRAEPVQDFLEPIPVSISMIALTPSEVPSGLLEIKGYLNGESFIGSPYVFVSEQHGFMDNRAEGAPLLFPGSNAAKNEECGTGYFLLRGYFEQKFKRFTVFAVTPYDENWELEAPCWLTNVDWKHDFALR